MSQIDLHMHSSYSDDGEISPQLLVDLCLDKEITYFAIADHNSVSGLAKAKTYADKLGVTLIPAIELDCTFNGINLHLLGYGIQYENHIFKEIEANIIAQEQVVSLVRMQRIRELGIEFLDTEINKLSKNGVVNGEMIAEAAMNYDKHQENPLLKPYYKSKENIGQRSDNPYVNFYWDFCSQGKPAYVEVKYISLEEAVKVINNNGGVPILAHPGNNIKENIELLEQIMACGVEGIEVYSSYHNQEQIAFYRDFTVLNQLLMTCGSDFHGKTKPSISAGGISCDGKEDSIITDLLNRINLH